MTCRKKWIAMASFLTVGLATWFAVVSRGQAPGMGGAIELLPPAAYPNSGAAVTTTGLLAPNPRGVDVPARKRLLGMVLVNTAPGASGIAGTTVLDVFFQSSLDNGLSWQDFAHVNVGPNGAGTYLVPISFVDGSSYPTTIPTNQD